mmetsp:Transcript_19275/g.27879  ORF Transcript_19275/g.27879 Transcript_19275/m.27879 type:complete len:346 (-) Transcript_19275:219-1256(-)
MNTGGSSGKVKKCWRRWSRCIRLRTIFHRSKHRESVVSEKTDDEEDIERVSSQFSDGINASLSTHTMQQSEHKDLFYLLNLNPCTERGRQLFDEDAVIQEVERDPQAAAQPYSFKSFWYENCYPLHQAIMLGASRNVVEILHRSYPTAVQTKCCDPDNLTALHVACKFGSSPDVISFLLEKYPAALKQRDTYGNTPLHTACFWVAPVKVLLLLLEKWPEALITQHDNDDDEKNTTLQIAQSRYLSPNVQSSLHHVSRICKRISRLCTTRGTIIDQSGLKEAVHFFMNISWCGGVMLTLDRHPNAARFLHVNIPVMPHFLSSLGHCCKITTMWSVISNMQDLFVDI